MFSSRAYIIERITVSTLHTIRLSNGSWPFPFAEVPPATQLTIPTNSCATNKVGDLHLLVMGYESVGAELYLKLRHTIRLANGNWPHPFGDVQAAINQGNIGQISAVACATNQTGDLHICVRDSTNNLRHTIRLANGDWPHPFGDVQAAINQGNIGYISAVACATNQAGDLHVCAANGAFIT